VCTYSPLTLTVSTITPAWQPRSSATELARTDQKTRIRSTGFLVTQLAFALESAANQTRLEVDKTLVGYAFVTLTGSTTTRLIALLGIVAFFGSAAIRTHDAALPNFGDIGRALLAVVVVVASYDSFLWRWLPLPGRPPRLYGTWKLELKTKEAPKGVPLLEQACYLSIRQTASRITARLLFEDGESKATAAILARDRLGKKLLLFYDFEPKRPSRIDPRRKGAVELDVAHRELNGKYWNDASAWGSLTSHGHTNKVYDTYRAASGSSTQYQ
jgi:hypothetical protein